MYSMNVRELSGLVQLTCRGLSQPTFDLMRGVEVTNGEDVNRMLERSRIDDQSKISVRKRIFNKY